MVASVLQQCGGLGMCLGWLPQCALSLSTCVPVLVGLFVLFAQTSQSMLVKFVIIISISAISSVLVVVFLAACACGASACCMNRILKGVDVRTGR